jgi:GT2 family glycosyltransferase
VDSGSTDKTLDIVKNYDVKLIEIKPEEFTYGYALNIGAEVANGEYLLNLSAHAIPIGADFLNRFLENFNEPKLAGVYARQIPLPEANPLVVQDYLSCYTDERKIQKDNIFFSNVCAMIQKDIWNRFRFDETLSYCEDWEWVRRIQQAGYYVVYEPKVMVYHSHNETLRQIYRRAQKEAMARKRLNPQSRMSLPGVLLSCKSQVMADIVYLLSKGRKFLSVSYDGTFLFKRKVWNKNRLRWIFYSPFYRFARSYGYYTGYREEKS